MQQTTSKNSLLAVLTVIFAFNFVDRLALGIVLQDIKVDLVLSDTQLGLLTGIAFALFYAAMGIPLARWADRGNRVTIISLTVALWSTAVALCGMAATFVQLLLIRVGIAVGEAGCQPAALSLISDYFSRAERPRAVSRYKLGYPIALVIGNVGAGWLNELYGWRMTFVILGLPGLVLAVIAVLTLKEPRRISAASADSTADVSRPVLPAIQPSLRAVFSTLWGNSAYRHLLLCLSLSHFFSYGILQWQPTFFVRSHGLQTGELGTWLAVVYGVGGLLGTWLGGEWAFRYAANNERLQLRTVALLFSMFPILTAAVYLAPNHYIAFAILGVSALGGAATNGPLFAATQTLVPAHMRATSVALVLFFCNMIGLGLGPLTTGALSDALRPMFGDDSLRYALVALCPGYFWCSWHLLQGSKTVTRDVHEAQLHEALGAASIKR